MAGETANFKLEIAAGMVKDYSSRWATPEQDTILDDIIEILRRAHEMPRTFDVDDLAIAIADYCITQYGPPLYDFSEAKGDAEEPSGSDVIAAAERTAVAELMPPELDIPDQH
jgi:hypothetical protein